MLRYIVVSTLSALVVSTLVVLTMHFVVPREGGKPSVASACIISGGVFSIKVDSPPEGVAQKITQITCDFN